MNAAESHIITAMAFTGLSVTTGQIAAGHPPTLKPIVGVFVTGLVLLAGANSEAFAPLSGQFATLIATTALLTTGVFTVTALVRYFTK